MCSICSIHIFTFLIIYPFFKHYYTEQIARQFYKYNKKLNGIIKQWKLYYVMQRNSRPSNIPH